MSITNLLLLSIASLNMNILISIYTVIPQSSSPSSVLVVAAVNTASLPASHFERGQKPLAAVCLVLNSTASAEPNFHFRVSTWPLIITTGFD